MEPSTCQHCGSPRTPWFVHFQPSGEFCRAASVEDMDAMLAGMDAGERAEFDASQAWA